MGRNNNNNRTNKNSRKEDVVLWKQMKDNGQHEVVVAEPYDDHDLTGSSTANDASDSSTFDEVVLVEIPPTKKQRDRLRAQRQRGQHERLDYSAVDTKRGWCCCCNVYCACVVANILAIAVPVLEVLIVYGYYLYMIELHKDDGNDDDELQTEELYVKIELPSDEKALMIIAASFAITIVVSIISIIGIRRSNYNVVVFACCNYLSKAVVSFMMHNYLGMLMNALIAFPHILLLGEIHRRHKAAVAAAAIAAADNSERSNNMNNQVI